MKINTALQNGFMLIEESLLFRNFQLTFAMLLCIGSFIALSAESEISNIARTAALFGDGTTEVVFSGEGLEGGARLVQENIEGTGIVEEGSIVDTIIFIIKYILIFSGILALFAFIWAGFLYITTFVNDDNTETAKKAMMYAAIGLLIILFSWIFVDFLTTFDLDGG